MSGVLNGLRVLDLSWGVAGPITTMLMADNGALVTKVDRPDGDPFEHQSGSRVWNRGKRRVTLDVATEEGADALKRLAAQSDVLLESFRPGTMRDLGLDWESLREACPQLIYCSISAYGQTGADSQRPGYDALVAARTGQQWEARGVLGGTISRLSDSEPILPGVEAPDGSAMGAPRKGPLFSGIPWPSHAAAMLASVAISAALHAREVTGRGQWVQTSLLQGVLATTGSAWQRVERPDTENFQSWVNDPRAPRGFFKCSDGKWIQQWMCLPSFLVGAAEGDALADASTLSGPRTATDRIGPQAGELIVLQHYWPLMAEAVSRFPSEAWAALAAKVGVPLQIIRSPEESLLDPLLLADGCVVAVPDAHLGDVLQVGKAYELSECPIDIVAAARAPGHDTEAVLGESSDPLGAAHGMPTRTLRHPLEGITVLDFGLAVAGPFGAQILSDLGAEVIKINRRDEDFWMSTNWGLLANRGKLSLGLDLKSPASAPILRRLVERADVVMLNIRADAARRVGIDEASLRAIKPNLIYCHSRGHERGPREGLPGNDQTGGALAGMQWMEGGLDHGGEPVWPSTSLGDPGNGLLCALAVVQALYHRDRTGVGQSVNTSIVNAHLLNTSSAWITTDGSRRGERPSLDRMQLGWSPLYRLYETASGWICLAIVTDEHWTALTAALPESPLTNERFGSKVKRAELADELGQTLGQVLAGETASHWQQLFEKAGVPSEISDPDFVLRFFDDVESRNKNLVTSYQHVHLGRMDVAGTLFDFSDTPARIAGAPFVPGQHTLHVLGEFGFSAGEISNFLQAGAVFEASAIT